MILGRKIELIDRKEKIIDMKVDVSIIENFFQGKDEYTEHWLFNHILDNGEFAFEKPDSKQRQMVNDMFRKVSTILNDFKPYNIIIFSTLFPLWKEVIRNVNIILAVGCPAPYDAMVREHDGKEYIIFDLIRILQYQKEGEDILSIIRKLITHEVAHICIHNEYPVWPMTYREKLAYITFDEGFAHILSFVEDITIYNFGSIMQKYYSNSIEQLKVALAEHDYEKQQKYLESSNCGSYWSKFAAISGKLYLVSHLEEIYDIYKSGPAIMLSNMF